MLWLSWTRPTGRASIAHRVVPAGHRTEPFGAGPVLLACGRTTPEPMTATVEIAVAGVTAAACTRCLTRRIG
ncbi:MAG TPA: hypothetical protein VGX21_03220 [Methylomirabilota bacterium]|nr:hypothetical protein [Methylomirabilota bacterium]